MRKNERLQAIASVVIENDKQLAGIMPLEDGYEA